MGDPQGKLPVPQRLQRYGAVGLSCQDEGDFRMHPRSPAQPVRIQCGKELFKPVFRIVEPGDRFVERFGGVVPKHILKFSEGIG